VFPEVRDYGHGLFGSMRREQINPMAMQLAINAITAYHGSPYKFDEFDASKIGTGEGAQAYGHGLYFSERPEVANEYQKNLTRKDWRIFRTGDAYAAKAYGTDDISPVFETPAKVKEWIAKERSGHLYKVDIPDEAVAKMLDWDKPLSEQPQNVQKALGSFQQGPFQMGPGGSINLAGGGTLRTYGTETGGLNYVLDMGGKQFRLSPQDVTNLIGTGVEGKSLYQIVSSRMGGDRAASEFLASAGIPGIKYLDQGSRASGKGTYNFVVFDPKLAKILGRE
jgi:hypothetical protein